jgi:hypothetical protein
LRPIFCPILWIILTYFPFRRGKFKLFLYTPWKHIGGPPILISVLEGSQFLASRFGRFIFGEGNSGPTEQEARWAPELVWTIWMEVKCLYPTRIRTTNCPTRRLVTIPTFLFAREWKGSVTVNLCVCVCVCARYFNFWTNWQTFIKRGMKVVLFYFSPKWYVLISHIQQ